MTGNEAVDEFIQELISRVDKLKWECRPQYVCEYVTEIASPKLGELWHPTPEDLGKPTINPSVYKISVKLVSESVQLFVNDQIMATGSFWSKNGLGKLFGEINNIIDSKKNEKARELLSPILKALKEYN